MIYEPTLRQAYLLIRCMLPRQTVPIVVGCGTTIASRTRRGDQMILIALSRVFHTPQASGTPTKTQNSAALASSPPLPMPNEPWCTPASLLALAACNLVTSSGLMFHLGSTGLMR